MKKIGINELLLTPLKKDYQEEKNRNNKLSIGINIIEASTKFLTVLTLSVLKKIAFSDYMEISKSLQDLTLGKYHYTLWSSKVNFKSNNRFYEEIQAIFSHQIDIKLELPTSILENKSEKVTLKAFLTETKKVSDGIDNLLLYGVEFRNIFKGHSAIIKEEDTKLFDKVFENLDLLLQEIDRVVETILTLKDLEFYIIDYDDRYKQVIVKDNNEEYSLSPMLVYSYCNLYDCNNRPKLYFVNRLSNSEAQYLDYVSNHPFTLKTKENEWEIGTLQKSSKKLNEEINYSNREKYKELSTVFIGRKEELKRIKNHILDNYHYNTLSIITGQPGIGKSAFVTQLQASIDEEKESDISYLFYAIKNQNTDNELKKFTESVKKFLEKNINFSNKDRKKTTINELFEVVNKSNSKKTLLLIIDGLDEFDNVVKFLHDINLSEVKHSNHIHLVLTSRPYPNILRTLMEIVSTLNNFKIYNREETEQRGYALKLGSLSEDETKSLVLEMLPREIAIESDRHNKIINTIIKKSESLPIYIHYISRMLEDKGLGNQENYLQSLEEWVERLPPKLENYYIQTFTEIPPLSRKILIAIYFSNYGASLNELYHIFKKEDVDKITFEHKYFSEIEMFLKEHDNDYYLFYHLSAKDAIFRYYITNQEDIAMFDTDKYIKNLMPKKEDKKIELKRFFKDSNYYEKLDHLFSFIFTLKSDCDFNETLKEIINTVIKKQNDKHLTRFLDKSFFNIYYNYCLASIVTFNSKISSEESINLTQNMKYEVAEFLKIFEKIGDKENTEVIAYAYKLSRLIGDYQKSMRYYDMYNRANLQTFIRICSDINRTGHIEEFKSKFDNWESGLTPEQKNILIEILILNFSINEEFREVYTKLDDSYQERLIEVVNFE